MILSPDKFIEKIKSHFDKKDKIIFSTVFIVGLISNFNFLIGDGVATDAMFYNTYVAGIWETQLGRFLIQFFDDIRFGYVDKLIIIIFALCCISLSAMLIRRIFKIEKKLSIFLLSLLIVLAPQFAETYFYIYCADSYLFAFLASVFAVFSLSKIHRIKQDIKWLIFAILSVFIVCGIYQAYLGVICALVLIYGIKKCIDESALLAIKNIIRNALIIGIAICVYYAFLKILCLIFNFELGQYKGANNLNFDIIFKLPETISLAYSDFLAFFFKDEYIINNSYYHRQSVYIFLFQMLVYIAISVIFALKKKRFSKSIAIISIVALLPIAMNVMDLIAVESHIELISGPGIIMTGVLFVFMFDQLKEGRGNNIIKWSALSALVVLAWTFLLMNSFTFKVRNRQYESFKAQALEVYNDIRRIDGFNENTKVVFSYEIEVNSVINDVDKTIGSTTARGIVWPTYAGIQEYALLYRKFFGINMNIADPDEYIEVIHSLDFYNMEKYPNKNSIKKIGDYIVVKISDKTYTTEDGRIILW